MINLAMKIPAKIMVAVSGGMDSMVALNFLSRRHNVTILHVNHGTPQAKDFQEFVEDYAWRNEIPFQIHSIQGKVPKGESEENFWRGHRLNIFNRQPVPVVTGHHLNDAVETWIWSSLHGNPRVIPVESGNVIRPFLLTPRDRLESYANRHGVEWIEDESNRDVRYVRNRIRHNIVPEALAVNPGLEKTIRKIYLKDMGNE